MRIVCVGAGPAGLYFAILMKEHNREHEITVLERNPAGVTYGWGVVFWDDLLDQLYASDPTTASEISSNAFRWNGQMLAVEGKDPARVEGHGYGLGRHRMLDLLRERAETLGVHVRFECEVEDRMQLPEADLIVACDGVNSRLRQLHAADFETEVRTGRNKYIWLGTAKDFDTFTFAFVPTAAGWIWAHAYAFDDDTSTFIVECSPETWLGLGLDRLDEDETLARLEQLFESHLNGHRLRTHGRGDAAPWLNFRTLTNETWHRENVVLMGDAAHTTHFTIGSGTKLALEDAIALAAELHEGSELETALEAYERKRQAALRLAQSEARFSAQWFENVQRYVELDPTRLFTLLRFRRSPLLARIPPPFYYWLYQGTRSVPGVRRLKRWVAPRIKALSSR